ncbi:DUF222 domain-containing protein [Planococcus sp. APC 4015]|nr:DUF222 domain-containing protein [Planococcus sp. APC 4015]
MSSPHDSPAQRLAPAAERIAACFGEHDATIVVGAMDDDTLLTALTDAASARTAIDLLTAAMSAEVARRSARDLGYEGLAQRKGHRTVTSLVQNITGQNRADVTRALRTGEELLPIASIPDAGPRAPTTDRWLLSLREALTAGEVSQAQFQAIRIGLGEPPVDRYPNLDPANLPDAWATAVELLLGEATTLPVEELRAAARIARDRLDPVGVTLRFEERFAARSFRAWIDDHGQHHARIVFDDETAAWVHAILSAALRPRRGPRFVEAGSEKNGDTAVDQRSNEQLQYDTILAVLRTGSQADPRRAFGDRQPGVRILVEATAIDRDGGPQRVTGVGHWEDGGAAVPGGVVEKYLCDAGSTTLTFDPFGRPLDVGREKRLFSRKQRIAIAARDGGCVWPSCTAPASWSEYHHIDHWSEDHGSTDVDDGVPLCRNCHLRLHNQRWRIRRERDPETGVDEYWLRPPPDPRTGEAREPIRLRTRSPRRFQAA